MVAIMNEQPTLTRLSPSLPQYVWDIHTCIPSEQQDSMISCHYTVVASHINQVWDYIESDRFDERIEVEAIIRGNPVIAILNQSESNQ